MQEEWWRDSAELLVVRRYVDCDATRLSELPLEYLARCCLCFDESRDGQDDDAKETRREKRKRR